jgi:hypothetical protein
MSDEWEAAGRLLTEDSYLGAGAENPPPMPALPASAQLRIPVDEEAVRSRHAAAPAAADFERRWAVKDSNLRPWD